MPFDLSKFKKKSKDNKDHKYSKDDKKKLKDKNLLTAPSKAFMKRFESSDSKG